MNIFLIIGLIVGFGGVIYGYVADEGVLSALLRPSAAAIVFGGTFGFLLLAFPISYIKQVPKALKAIFFRKKKNYAQVIDLLYNLANVARRDGILAMEAEAEKIKDPFIKKGLLYVADGVEPEFLKEVLENEIEASVGEMEKAAKVLEGAGGVAPACGVLGTVMGMVSILRDMGGDTEELGKKNRHGLYRHHVRRRLGKPPLAPAGRPCQELRRRGCGVYGPYRHGAPEHP